MKRTWWIIAGVVVAAVVAVLILGIERGRAPSFVLFFGRFHPTIVHFPIAFLILGVLVDALAPRFPSAAKVRPAVPVILLLGALSAFASVILGYLLSLGGGYDETLLSVHMWLGLAVMTLAFALALVAFSRPQPGRLFGGSMLVMGVLVVVAGHLGGSLARGSGYLTYYLPSPVKQLVGLDAGPAEGLIQNVDSAMVFADLVQPILDRRCVKCHGPSKSKGDLRLDSREGVEAGSRDGVVVVAGNPAQSEVVRRISLAPFDEDAMPPEGEPPLDVGETEVIRWWIANGASFDARIAEIPEAPTAVETYLRRVAAPRAPIRSGIYALDVPSADTAAVAALRQDGLVITRIDPEAPFLAVTAAGFRDRFSDAELEKLRPIFPQIAHLDAGHTAITSAGVWLVAAMPHLVRLHLEDTDIDDDALAHLDELEYLEYLNLYNTRVTDEGLVHLRELPALRSVYLWQTHVTDDGAATLRHAHPAAHVNTGARLVATGTDSTSTPAP